MLNLDESWNRLLASTSVWLKRKKQQFYSQDPTEHNWQSLTEGFTGFSWGWVWPAWHINDIDISRSSILVIHTIHWNLLHPNPNSVLCKSHQLTKSDTFFTSFIPGSLSTSSLLLGMARLSSLLYLIGQCTFISHSCMYVCSCPQFKSRLFNFIGNWRRRWFVTNVA